jgi:hypothetical protein
MKKYILLSFFLVSFVYSYSQKSDAKVPDIYFIKKTIDFGTIEEGTNPKIKFEFYNSGSAPLLLKEIKPDCGCTMLDAPNNKPIMPGQSSSFTVTFASKGYANQKVNKSVRVTTNIKEKNGADKIVIVNFKGSVKPKSN